MVASIGKLVIISGVKSGVGATVLVTRLAAELAGSGSVLVVNIDGASDRSAGGRNLADVAQNLNFAPQMLKSYLGFGPKNIGVLQADSVSAVGPVLKKLAGIYSFILVDAGSRFGDEMEPLFPLAHRIFVVTSADTASVLATEDRIRTLRRMGVEMFDIVVSDLVVDGAADRAAIRERLGQRCLAPSELIGRIAGIDAGRTIRSVESNDGAANTENINLAECGIKTRVLDKLFSTKEIKEIISGTGIRGKDRDFLEKKIAEAVHNILDGEAGSFVADRNAFIADVIDEAIGLGPLEKFMADPEVTEVMVNAHDDIYVEKKGKISRVDARFSGDKNLMAVIERIVSPIGRRIDESSPIVDARLPDGSRVHIIIPPLSLKGPTVTIRRFNKGVFSSDDLISHGSMSDEMAAFLKEAVEKRVNILVSGGTGSGKTTMLNILSSFIPAGERIVTIEDSAELKLVQPHVVRLESRPPNIEGKGEVSIRDLVKASLRMRPDRIVVGECRGAEALDMLQAMNTGHDGSLTTVHANSCRDSLARLETLVLFAGFDLPVRAIREQIAAAIDLIIQVKRQRDGSRKIVSISEISGLEGQVTTMQELFAFEGEQFVSSGFRAKCLEGS